MPSEQHSEDHIDAGPDDTGERPDIFPMQLGRAEDAADVAELAAAAQGVRPCPRTVVAVPGARCPVPAGLGRNPRVPAELVPQRLWKARMVTDVAGAVSPVLGGLVRELDRAAPTDLVDVCRTLVVQNLGVQECALLLADYSETTLEPVPGVEHVMELPRLGVDDSAAGAAYRQQRAVHVDLPTSGDAPLGSGDLPSRCRCGPSASAYWQSSSAPRIRWTDSTS